jgi:hypothetical protein
MAPKWETKKGIITCFLVVSDYFFLKNGLNILVRGLFLGLAIWQNVWPNYRPLGTFKGPFRGAQMAPK